MDSDTDYPLDEDENLSAHAALPEIGSPGYKHSLENLEDPDEDYRPDGLYSDSEVESRPAARQGTKHSSLKRPAKDSLAFRSFKRNRGVLNTDYLDLLNADIQDAAQQVCVEEEAEVKASQFGATFWSSTEKKLFFEAVARLGRDDLPGIASRIQTKSEIEVNHYLNVLQTAQTLRQQEGLRPAIGFSEYPAAVELSQQLCYALDEAADAISVRQEHKEEQREESKWGGCWLITPRIAQDLDKGEGASGDRQMAFAGTFNLRNWLKLSERVFMNSSVPTDNWHLMDEDPPSMWATTFEDFHSLAISITRRLVQATIFFSMSRIRAKRELIPTTRDIVRPQDVEAAVASLGMTANSQQFWRKCARRLRLEVYEEPPDKDEEGDQEALSYDEVEEALCDEMDETSKQDPGEPAIFIKEESTSGDEVREEEFTEKKLGDEDSDESGTKAPVAKSDDEEASLTREVDEILQFSAADFPKTHRAKQSLKTRVDWERSQEQYAEQSDQHDSWQAEAKLWDLLQKKPPMELPKIQKPGPLQRSKLDAESMFPIGRHWRSKMNYHSEWEVDERPQDDAPNDA